MLLMPAIDIDISFHIQVMFIAMIRLNPEASIDLDKHPLFGAKNYLRRVGELFEWKWRWICLYNVHHKNPLSN